MHVGEDTHFAGQGTHQQTTELQWIIRELSKAEYEDTSEEV